MISSSVFAFWSDGDAVVVTGEHHLSIQAGDTREDHFVADRADLRDVWASGPDDITIAAKEGILHFDGTEVALEHEAPFPTVIEALWGDTSVEWAVGYIDPECYDCYYESADALILQAPDWAALPIPDDTPLLSGIDGTSDHLLAVGATAMEYEDGAWTDMGLPGGVSRLHHVAAAGPGQWIAAGDNSGPSVHWFDGESWTTLPVIETEAPYVVGVAARSPEDAYVALPTSSTLEVHRWDGESWTLFASLDLHSQIEASFGPSRIEIDGAGRLLAVTDGPTGPVLVDLDDPGAPEELWVAGSPGYLRMLAVAEDGTGVGGTGDCVAERTPDGQWRCFEQVEPLAVTMRGNGEAWYTYPDGEFWELSHVVRRVNGELEDVSPPGPEHHRLVDMVSDGERVFAIGAAYTIEGGGDPMPDGTRVHVWEDGDWTTINTTNTTNLDDLPYRLVSSRGRMFQLSEHNLWEWTNGAFEVLVEVEDPRDVTVGPDGEVYVLHFVAPWDAQLSHLVDGELAAMDLELRNWEVLGWSGGDLVAISGSGWGDAIEMDSGAIARLRDGTWTVEAHDILGGPNPSHGLNHSGLDSVDGSIFLSDQRSVIRVGPCQE